MKNAIRFLGLVPVLLLLVACDGRGSVNRSLRLEDGQKLSEGLHSVNGSILVGSDCRVGGSCRTVNGSIEIGGGSTVQALKTVNGSIEVGPGSRVYGDIETVNGSVSLARDVKAGDVDTVNGDIELSGARLDGDIRTLNGSIALRAGSRVRGDIVIRRTRGFSVSHPRRLTVRIEAGSILEGDVRVEDREDVDVVVLVSPDSAIKGRVKGARLEQKLPAEAPGTK